MDLDRVTLKGRLLNLRPRCDVCGAWMNRPPQMHESVVSKQRVRGWKPALRGLINHEVNCHLVCGEACHQLASPLLMVAIQIERHGKARIQAWIDSLPFKIKYYWDRGLTEAEAHMRVEALAPWILGE